jgi:hypothetical protein
MTVFEGEPSVFLGTPIVPWGARQASPNIPSQKTILRIRTREIRYLIFTCKIPADLPSKRLEDSPVGKQGHK